MYDNKLVLDIIILIEDNLKTILQRTGKIRSADDFTDTETGMILLDSIS